MNKDRSLKPKISFILKICILQIIIAPFITVTALSCTSDQNQITYYLQSDMVTQNNPFTTCLQNNVYGIDVACLSYYLNSTTGRYNCIQCDTSYSFQIKLDSGRNFCGIDNYGGYNLDCALYADKNPQIFDQGYTLYQCITCKDSTESLISVQHFLYDFLINNGIDVNLYNRLCTKLPLISGKNGGQDCLVYQASSNQYDTSGVLTNNVISLVCAQCRTTAVSMDCSFACAANEYEVNFLSSGKIISFCASGEGTQSWDNIYMTGYSYGCLLYEYYDATNNVLGKCVDLVANCLEYDLNTLFKCIRCPQHYYLNYLTNQCIPSVIYCASYLGTMCTQCIQPYSLVNKTCVMPSPSNCDVYNSSSGNCSKCKNQYFLNSLMKCDPYKACPNYQYLNTSINQCQDGQIQNCLAYFIDGIQCSQCEQNYQIDSLGFSCKYVPPAVICPNNTDKIRYEIFTGKCVQVDINCKYYLENGYCYQCIEGYYQFNGSCYSNSQITNFTVPTLTIVCQNDEYLVGVNCIKIPSNCAKFDRRSNLCQECAQGYELIKNQNFGNICVLNTVCPPGQYSLNSICTVIDVNCLNFNFSTNNCDSCVQGFISIGPNCLLPTDTICNNSRMWFNGARCVGISQTCQTFNKTSGQCWTCYNPYVIIFPGICGINQNSSIIYCPQNTIQVANQVCVPIVQNCQSYQLIYGYCLTCVYGYEINPISHTCTKIAVND